MRERDRQNRLIGSAGNFDVPASPVFALLIAFRNHVMGHDPSNIPRRLKVRVPVSFGVFDEATLCPDVEIVESCFCLEPRWKWLTEAVA
nr:hypothetical protein [Microvirga sp. HBU65207]